MNRSTVVSPPCGNASDAATVPFERSSRSTSPNFNFATEKTLVLNVRHFPLPLTLTRA
jgi:hypothetical protein